MATDPLSRESLSPVQWWGFRLRVPPGYIPKPVSIVDRLAAGLATAVILEIAFLFSQPSGQGDRNYSFGVAGHSG